MGGKSLELTYGFHRCYIFKDNISGGEEDGRGGVLRGNPKSTEDFCDSQQPMASLVHSDES